MKTFIKIRTSFVGFHQWPDAPDEVSFLRHRHRHVFHVEAIIRAGHDNRQVEFFTAKKDLNKIISDFGSETGSFSCEMMARLFFTDLWDMKYNVAQVEVSEDGENSGIVSTLYS